jgi:hypothetical protein
MEPHLTLAQIATLLAEDGSRPVVRHLAESCPACGAVYREAEALIKRFRHWSPEVAILEGVEADGLFAKLMAAGRDFASRSWQVEHDASLQTWGVAWVALEKARQCLGVQGGAAQARDLALLAAKIAETLGAFYHPDSVADLKALTYAASAAAERALGDVDMQLKWLGPAATALEAGSGDPEVKREVAELLGVKTDRSPAGECEHDG